MNSKRVPSRALALALAALTATGLSLTVDAAAYASPQKATTKASTGKKAATPVGTSTTFTPTVADPTTATAEELIAGAEAAGLPAPTTAPGTGFVKQTDGSDTARTFLAQAAADDSTAGGEITRDEILARAQSWIDQQVPYSQTAYHTDSNGTYRQDCSGFVSMAWHLSVGSNNNWGATTWTLPNYATRLGSLDDLLPGDMIDKEDQHVVLFKGWTDSSHTTAVIMEEARPGTNARQTTLSRSYLTDNGFHPYRYDKVIERRVNTTPSLNGDANADMAVLSTDGDLAIRNNIGAGDGFGTSQTVSQGWANFLGNPGQGRLYFADVNGDGLKDLVVHSTDGDVAIRLNLGAGDGFGTSKVVSQGWANFLGGAGKGRLYFADANGDGNADMLVHSPDGDVALRLNIGAGDGFGTSKVVSQGWANFLGNSGQGRLSFADANGDGNADMIVHSTDGDVALRLNLSAGDGFGTSKTVSQGWANFLGGAGKGRLYFADANGDGNADMLVHSPDGDVALRLNIGAGDGFGTSKTVSQGWANFLGNSGQGRLYFD
ncbi:C40 family peptidase [Streptomyces wedmorensis]